MSEPMKTSKPDQQINNHRDEPDTTQQTDPTYLNNPNEGNSQDQDQNQLDTEEEISESKNQKLRKSENDFKIFVGGLPGTILEGNPENNSLR